MSIWLWLLFALLALICGAIGLAVGYLAMDTFLNWLRKKKIKKLDKEMLADPGKTQINEKEVKEDERRRFDKIREFEKLRRVSQVSGKNPGTGGGVITPTTDSVDGRQPKLPPFPDGSSSEYLYGDEKDERKSKWVE